MFSEDENKQIEIGQALPNTRVDRRSECKTGQLISNKHIKENLYWFIRKVIGAS